MKLLGKKTLFPNLVHDIIVFKMKLKLLIAQLEDEDLSQFPYLKQQFVCTADNGKLRKCAIKTKLLQDSYESRFCDFSEEEDCVLTFTVPGASHVINFWRCLLCEIFQN